MDGGGLAEACSRAIRTDSAMGEGDVGGGGGPSAVLDRYDALLAAAPPGPRRHGHGMEMELWKWCALYEGRADAFVDLGTEALPALTERLGGLGGLGGPMERTGAIVVATSAAAIPDRPGRGIGGGASTASSPLHPAAIVSPGPRSAVAAGAVRLLVETPIDDLLSDEDGVLLLGDASTGPTTRWRRFGTELRSLIAASASGGDEMWEVWEAGAYGSSGPESGHR